MTAPVSAKATFEEIELPRGSLRMYEDMVSIKFGDNVVYIHQTTDDFRDFLAKLNVLSGEIAAACTAIDEAFAAATLQEDYARSSRTWLQADVTYGLPYPSTQVSSATVCWSVVCVPDKSITVDFRLADCSHTARDYDELVIDMGDLVEQPSDWSVTSFVRKLADAVSRAVAYYQTARASKSVLAFPSPIS